MKQFQKWQGKFAEAKSGEEFAKLIDMIFREYCRATPEGYCYDCKICRKNWLDSEVKEDDEP